MDEILTEDLLRHLTRLFPCPAEKRELQHQHFFRHVLTALTAFSDLDLRDPNFDADILRGSLDQFYSRYWEIEAALHFAHLGYRVTRKNIGPDFLMKRGDLAFYVEATALTANEALVAHEKAAIRPTIAVTVPEEEIVLRYTTRLAEKRDKIRMYVRDGRVHNEPVVIAVNAYRAFPFHNGYGPHYPFAVRAVLPHGKLFASIDTKSFRIVEQGFQYRPEIFKTSGNPVATDLFLRDEGAQISAVMATHRMFVENHRPGLVLAGLIHEREDF
jgi:hypothetical protein